MLNRDIRREATDLAATAFQDAVIWLPELIRAAYRRGENVVRGRTFDNCLLQGPAVFLSARNVRLEGCNLGNPGGDIRNLVLRPASPTSVIGAVPFEDCVFRDCDFDRVGYTGGESFLESVLSVPSTGGPG